MNIKLKEELNLQPIALLADLQVNYSYNSWKPSFTPFLESALLHPMSVLLNTFNVDGKMHSSACFKISRKLRFICIC